MPEDNRTDAQKSTNASLTPPDEDQKQQATGYPAEPYGREQVRTGSPEHISPPGHAAPQGRKIDPNVDPNAPEAVRDVDVKE